MNISTTSQEIEAIAIGGFDGMHIAHQHLFNELGDNGAIIVIESGFANLTPGVLRENYSTHRMIYYPLDQIKSFDGLDFIKSLKKTFVNLKKIVVGYDFYFGKNRAYCANDLKKAFDGEIVVVDEVISHDTSVHSNKIRESLQNGDIKKANIFLGHNYTIYGEHVDGQGLGKKELFPTINIKTEGFLIPKDGVYASFCSINGSDIYYKSVTFIGHRVTTDGTFAIETYIIDKDITKVKDVKISFISYLRENKKFDNLELLKDRIENDIDLAKNSLNIATI